MSRRSYSGNARPTTLAADLQVTDTSLTLLDGTNYPDGSAGPFVLTLDLGLAGEEKVLAASRSGTAVGGLTRGFDGTVAGRHSAGAPVAHTISAVDMDEANGHVNNTADPHPQYLTSAEGTAAYTPLAHVTALDPHTQYLTAARGDALFLTPADGDALFLTPAEGAAAYAPKSHSDAITVGTDPHPQYVTAAELATAQQPTALTNVPLGTGWSRPASAASTALAPLAYWRTPDGIVHLAGILFNDNAYNPNSQIAGTLPSGYRPAQTHFFRGAYAVASPGLTGSIDFEVRADGTIRPVRSDIAPTNIAASLPHSFGGAFWQAA